MTTTINQSKIVMFDPLNPKLLDVMFKLLLHPLEAKGVDFFWNDSMGDNNITKLRRLQTNLGTPIYTSTLQQKTLLKALMRCDVAIGAKRGNTRAPILVTQTMMENMKKGAVIVDVSIDTGGCFESSEVTTHEKPTFIKNDVIHYCVPNIPSRYARTASMSISNMLEPILLEIAENGGVEKSIAYNKGIREGVYCYSGILTKKNIADWFGLEYRDLNLLLM